MTKLNTQKDPIYFDNAATSWPKPPEVLQAMNHFMHNVGANPGRGAHRRAVEAAKIIYQTREAVAKIFGFPDPLAVILCSNATEAINIALQGLLRPTDRVITSSMEHNSVMRPLRQLESQGVIVEQFKCSSSGIPDMSDIETLIAKPASMVVMTHASNVNGALFDIRQIGAMVRKHGGLFCVDAAQTAGAVAIDMEGDFIDLLAFSGHKSLYGPMGTGGLVIGSRVDIQKLRPLKTGGTGSRSEHQIHPNFLPDMLEAGTPNAVGFAGLNAGINYVLKRGIESIRQHELKLLGLLTEQLKLINNVRVIDADNRIAIVSFIIDGIEVSEAEEILDREHGILCRGGLHCSPAAHKTLGTFPKGTLRLSLSAFNTEEEVFATLRAIGAIARKSR